VVWFIGMAIATAAILTVGTLSAADILRWQRPRRLRRRRLRHAPPASPATADSSSTPTEHPTTPMGVHSRSTSEDSQGSSAA
jgi:hypothetical protein